MTLSYRPDIDFVQAGIYSGAIDDENGSSSLRDETPGLKAGLSFKSKDVGFGYKPKANSFYYPALKGGD